MKRFKTVLLLLLSMFLICCEAAHINESTYADVSSIFPFSEKGQWYHNVQIVNRVEEIQGGKRVWNYQFIATIVDAEKEDQNVDVELEVTNEAGERLCGRTSATVNQKANHIQIENCRNDKKLDKIKVRMKAANSGSSLKLVKVYEFEL